MALVPTAASAEHSATALVSTGPAGNGFEPVCPFNPVSHFDPEAAPCPVGISRDGKRIVFETRGSLVSSDTDGLIDVYERSGGSTTLVSTGPVGGNGRSFARWLDSSDDGSRVLFWTQEQLVSADTDDSFDVYERSSGATTLISTGPTGGNGPYAAEFGGASEDGARVFFRTQEQLTGADTDDAWDLYERAGGTTTLISTGTTPANQGYPVEFAGTSANGAHVFFRTRESLAPEDSDNCSGKGCFDIYERFGGAISLVSTGPSGGNAAQDATLDAVSDDGSRVFFETKDPLVAGDPDSLKDIYERSSGATTLISTGPADSNQYAPCTMTTLPPGGGPCPVRISADGAHVFFFTHESLVPGDTGYLDLYERFGGTTSLVSTGPTGGNGPVHVDNFDVISKDGTRIFFSTSEALVSSDTDNSTDIYERSGGATNLVAANPSAVLKGASEDGSRVFGYTGADVVEYHAGTTTLISTGPSDTGGGDAQFMVASPDGAHVVFRSTAGFVPEDTDCVGLTYDQMETGVCSDLYDVSIAYQTPQAATQLSVSLVPTFLQCGTGANPANGQHSPPLGTRACLPPKPGSNVAIFGPQAVGTSVLTVVPGDPATITDEADVSITANLTDVQNKTGGGDYNPNASGPDLTLTARLRLTDLANCSPSGCTGPYQRTAATTTDLDFPVAVDCSSTADPSAGSTCALTTSADAAQPGAIVEARQTVAQAFRMRLNDSGVNGVRGDSDDRIFSTQGIYVP
jgi:Tol biopolymer transport system component